MGVYQDHNKKLQLDNIYTVSISSFDADYNKCYNENMINPVTFLWVPQDFSMRFKRLIIWIYYEN